MLLVVNPTKIGIYEEACGKEFALVKGEAMCRLCFDKLSPLPDYCLNDPRSIFLLWSLYPAIYMTTESNFSFNLAIEVGSQVLNPAGVRNLVY